MTDMNTAGATTAPKRPTFLTVLCILTFVGCAWGLYTNFTGYFAVKASADAMSESSAQLSEQMNAAMDSVATSNNMTPEEREMAGKLGEALSGAAGNPAGIATTALVQGIMCILCLVGALMMWNLKKTGFYIYTLAQVVTIAAPFIWVGGLGGGLVGILGAIFPIIFIILYALNLKHMR